MNEDTAPVGSAKACGVCGGAIGSSGFTPMERATGRCMSCLVTVPAKTIDIPAPYYSFSSEPEETIIPDERA